MFKKPNSAKNVSSNPYEINVDGVENRRKYLIQLERLSHQDHPSKETIAIESGVNIKENKIDNSQHISFQQNEISYLKSDTSCLNNKLPSLVYLANSLQEDKVESKDDVIEENTKNLNETDNTCKSSFNSPINLSVNFQKTDKERRKSRMTPNRKSILDKYFINQRISTTDGIKYQYGEGIDALSRTQDQDKDQIMNDQQSSHNKIISFFYVYQFVKAFLLKSISLNANLLTIQQYKFINDKSVYIKRSQQKQVQEQQLHKYNNIFERVAYLKKNQYQINSKQSTVSVYQFCLKQIAFSVAHIVENFLKHIKIISPNNFLLMLWDLFFILNSLFLIIIYPFYISFDEVGFLKGTLQQMQQISLLSIIFDMFLGFHTGIYEFGEIVLQKDKIYHYYIHKRFLVDIISISLLMYGIFQNVEIMTFIALIFRYKQMIDKLAQISSNLQLKQKLSTYYDLIKLIGYISLVIHFFGCGFYYVGVKSLGVETDMDNWIINVGLQHSGIIDKYIFSIYFIMITMITIGYGDIHPVNTLEKMYTMLVAFITCGLFAFTINLIGTILTETQRKYNEFNRKQTVISKYLINRQIDYSTQIRVFKYLEYLDNSLEENTHEGQQILQQCSKDIRDDILKDYYGKVIKKCSIMKDTFSKEFIETLSLKMRERTFAPDELILERGASLKNLYFIIKGETEYFFNKLDSHQSISTNDQRVIDFRIFASQQISDISIRSKGITVVSYIEITSFQEIIDQFQVDKEKFKYLKDQFKNDQRYLNSCISCGNYKHNIFDCPQLCYKINKVMYFQKLNCSRDQNRSNTYARRKSKVNCMLHHHSIREKVRQYKCEIVQEMYGSFVSDYKLFQQLDDKEFNQTIPKVDIQKYCLQREAQKEGFCTLQNISYQSENSYYSSSIRSSCSSSGSYSNSDMENSSQKHSKQSVQEEDDTCSINRKHHKSKGNIENQNNTRSGVNLFVPFNKMQTSADKKEPSINLIKPEDIEFKSDAVIVNINSESEQDQLQDGNHSSKKQYFQNEEIRESSLKQVPLGFMDKSNKRLSSIPSLPESILKKNYQRNEKKQHSKLMQAVLDVQSKKKTINFIERLATFDEIQQQKSSQQAIGSQRSIKGHGSSRSIHSKTSMRNIPQREGEAENNAMADSQQQVNNKQEHKKRFNLGKSDSMTRMFELVQQIVAIGKLQNSKTTSAKNFVKRKTTVQGETIESRQSNIFQNELSLNIQNSNQDNILSKQPILTSVNETNFTQDDNAFFGKCGQYFESMREYQFYYPKFNYSIVIKSFKKHKQLEQRMIQRSSVIACQIKRADSQKHLYPKKRPKNKSQVSKKANFYTTAKILLFQQSNMKSFTNKLQQTR